MNLVIYWQIGKRIVEHEQKGKNRAEYSIQFARCHLANPEK